MIDLSMHHRSYVAIKYQLQYPDLPSGSLTPWTGGGQSENMKKRHERLEVATT